MSTRGASSSAALHGRGRMPVDSPVKSVPAACLPKPHYGSCASPFVGSNDGILLDTNIDAFDFVVPETGDEFLDHYVHVPGFNASNLNIQSMWRVWGRHVLKAGTSFSSFWRALHSNAEGLKEQAHTAPDWPMPLPYYNVKACTPSEDVNAEELALRSVINLQVGFLNFLCLGKCKYAPRRICGKVSLTANQAAIVKRLRRLNGAWSKHEIITAAKLGRTAAKQERQEAVLAKLQTLAESVVGGLGKYGRRVSKVGGWSADKS